MRIRTDDPIWRPRVRLPGPLGIEATASAWVVSVGVLTAGACLIFWTVYGAVTAFGLPLLVAVILAAGLAVIVAGGAAVVSGVLIERHVTPATPPTYRLGVAIDELRAPQTRPPGERGRVRSRIPNPPTHLTAARPVRVALPTHIDQENVCVRTECLNEVPGRPGGVPQT